MPAISLTAIDINYTYPALGADDVDWVEGNGNTVARQGDVAKVAGGGWSGLGYSTRTVGSGNNAYFQFPDAGQLNIITGFDSGTPATGTTGIEHGFRQNGEFAIAVEESGISRLSTSKGPGDVFSAHIAAGKVTYYKNRSLLYVSEITPVYPLHLTTVINSSGVVFRAAEFDNDLQTNNLSIFAEGTLQNATINAHQIVSTGAASGFSYVSTPDNTTNTELQVTITDATVQGSFGFSSTQGDTLASIDHGCTINATGGLDIIQAGAVQRADAVQLTDGDTVFLVLNEDESTFDVFHNGNFIWAIQSQTFTYPIHAAFVEVASGNFINSAAWNADFDYAGLGELEVDWSHANANTLDRIGDVVKVASNGWDTAASSLRTVTTGNDSFIEYVSNGSSQFMVGFDSGVQATGTSTVENGFYFVSSTDARVREGGTNLVQEDYVAGDVFRVELINDVFKYYKNGVEIYESLTTPTYPMAATVLVNTQGLAIKNIAFDNDLQLSTITEDLTSTDIIAASKTALISVTETHATSDTASGSVTAGVSITDTAATDDIVSSYKLALSSVTESHVTGDTVTGSSNVTNDINESIATGDTVSGSKTGAAAVTDSSASSDTVSSSTIKIGIVTDTAASSDTVSGSNVSLVNVEENLTQDSTISGTKTTSGSVTDNANVFDFVQSSDSTKHVVMENAMVGDTASGSKTGLSDVEDSAQTGDINSGSKIASNVISITSASSTEVAATKTAIVSVLDNSNVIDAASAFRAGDGIPHESSNDYIVDIEDNTVIIDTQGLL